MKISIITPTYNDAVSIRETYRSIVGQTYREWEWIVINDGSTDNTREIIKIRLFIENRLMRIN